MKFLTLCFRVFTAKLLVDLQTQLDPDPRVEVIKWGVVHVAAAFPAWLVRDLQNRLLEHRGRSRESERHRIHHLTKHI